MISTVDFVLSKKEIKNNMDWIQTLLIIATVIGCAYYIHRDIMNDMKAQTARTDKLYEMFISLIKETRK